MKFQAKVAAGLCAQLLSQLIVLIRKGNRKWRGRPRDPPPPRNPRLSEVIRVCFFYYGTYVYFIQADILSATHAEWNLERRLIVRFG